MRTARSTRQLSKPLRPTWTSADPFQHCWVLLMRYLRKSRKNHAIRTRGCEPSQRPTRGISLAVIALVDELVKDVAKLLLPEQAATESERLLTILGPSGSGKSSVVMAGLLPRLQRG